MATSLHTEVLAANAAYVASFGEKSSLALPPARAAAFLGAVESRESATRFLCCRPLLTAPPSPAVCMDARINPAAALGLKEGDAHVIRNAGGRASDDAIRSFVISHKLLGTKEWFVVHHTDCGMEYFTSAQLATLLEGNLATASIVADAAAPKGVAFQNSAAGGGCAAGHAVHWLHIEDQAASVREDVAKIASHELVAVRLSAVEVTH